MSEKCLCKDKSSPVHDGICPLYEIKQSHSSPVYGPYRVIETDGWYVRGFLVHIGALASKEQTTAICDVLNDFQLRLQIKSDECERFRIATKTKEEECERLKKSLDTCKIKFIEAERLTGDGDCQKVLDEGYKIADKALNSSKEL